MKEQKKWHYCSVFHQKEHNEDHTVQGAAQNTLLLVERRRSKNWLLLSTRIVSQLLERPRWANEISSDYQNSSSRYNLYSMKPAINPSDLWPRSWMLVERLCEYIFKKPSGTDPIRSKSISSGIKLQEGERLVRQSGCCESLCTLWSPTSLIPSLIKSILPASEGEEKHYLCLCCDVWDVLLIVSTKLPASAMIVSVISSESNVVLPFFSEEDLTVTADAYSNLINTVKKPYMECITGDCNYMFE